MQIKDSALDFSLKRLSSLLFPVLAFCAASANAADYWVGEGSSCDFPTIHQAIAAARATPETDTIRIARNGAYLNQALRVDTSITLIGGYPTCGAADREGHTVLGGNQKEAVLKITSGRVHIDRLDITHGGRDPSTSEWGGIWIGGNARVHLYDSVVRDNYGGRSQSGASHGGGITVRGRDALLAIERWVDIRGNQAAGNGGGILIDGGTVQIRPHGVAIRDNHAYHEKGRGGGIAIVNGGLMDVIIDPYGPELPMDGVFVGSNSATDCGGGIYVADAGSQMFAASLVVDDNKAIYGKGGGLCVFDQGHARLDAQFGASISRNCPPWRECLNLSHNQSQFSGAAVAVFGGGSVHLDGVVVRDNRLLNFTSAFATSNTFHLVGDASALTVVSSLIVDNKCAEADPSCAVVRTIGGKLYVAHATFARNGNGSGALIALDADSSVGFGSVVDARIHSSLVADKEKLYTSVRTTPPFPESTFAIQCVLKNRGRPEGVAGGVAPITFRDAAGGDYHLAPGNTAVDYCDGVASAPWSQNPDLDRQPRGIDDPAYPNRGGLDTNKYDLGAYEFRAVHDRIFAGGFEATP